ncbi:MAG: beta-glucosidase, partial [Rhodothermales bacterium]|nr:beta-glucosidase [Rhodothermales bacterium]
GDRVNDLLDRMTLEEKAAQMMCVWQQKAETLIDANGKFDLDKARLSFAGGLGIGQVGRPSDSGSSGHEPSKGLDARSQAELANEIQRFFVEDSRLGIPVFFHEECLHGHAAVDGTSFPQPIALGASFNPALVESLYAMTAEETRVRGAHQALTPVVDVARDPRWGRVEETFGEDPWLVSRMGIAAVRGFQGDATFAKRKHVVATLKHFAAHGQPEAGMNCAPVNVSERELRDVFLFPFRAAIRDAGAISVMASYNEIDGVPSHASKWLLRDVLREEWRFTGFVVSDYYAIWELNNRPDTHAHSVAANKKEACALAIGAGVNIEFPEPDCYQHVVHLVEEGEIEESVIDDLVRPMLFWKFKMGLFEDPYVDPDEANRIVGSRANRALALQAARESITLLKKDNDLLPLDRANMSKIAVIGPNANRELLGGYSGVPLNTVSVLDGIRSKVGEGVSVLHGEGCTITVGGSWNEDAVVLGDPEHDQALISEAVELAEQADVVVLALGGNEQTAREAWSRTHMGDRTNLQLVGRQNELVDAVLNTGKPVVALLFNGRPLAITEISDRVDALLECWYLGQETGHAVADVLFGDFNPGGKLPITIPRSVGHLPAFYNHKPSARRGYLFDDVSPLFAFGYGLSYSTFDLSNVRLASSTIGLADSTQVLVDITNTGTMPGSEVVQLYVRDKISSVTRPVKELKGFERVNLAPAEQITLSLDIASEQLAFHDINYNYVVESGEFDIMVGTSSRDEDLTTVSLIVRS